MRKLILLAALVAVVLPSLSSAAGPRFNQWGFRQRGGAPMAAPWFLYWPYDAYFQTPAPTGYYGGYGPMTPGPYAGQIGPAAGQPPRPPIPGPTGFNY